MMLFDQPYYLEINEARWSAAQGIIANLNGINTCLDVGCGPGWFAERLVQAGLRVVGVDGREELVREAGVRVPGARFVALDITSSLAVNALPKADLVFCFGLLYHLENPFAAIRNLYACTSKYLLIETQVAPDNSPSLRLISEGKNITQGLHFHALIPSRMALVKMLYVAGFQQVLRYTGKVHHDDFTDSVQKTHRREIFLVNRDSMNIVGDFVLEEQPVTPKIDYSISIDKE